MRANVEHNHVRHDHVVILSIETEPVPRVPADERIIVDDLGYADDGIIHVTARFGYMETPDVPGALAMLDPAATEGQLQLDQASYFLSKIELRPGDAPTMARWRKRLFIATSYITADAAEYFGLPATAPSSWAPTSRCDRHPPSFQGWCGTDKSRRAHLHRFRVRYGRPPRSRGSPGPRDGPPVSFTLLDAAQHDVLAFVAFPREVWRQIWSNDRD